MNEFNSKGSDQQFALFVSRFYQEEYQFIVVYLLSPNVNPSVTTFTLLTGIYSALVLDKIPPNLSIKNKQTDLCPLNSTLSRRTD